MPALRYTLEWIFQFVIFQDETHFIFRQCSSALIALLAASNSIHNLSDKLGLCFSKWFSMATQYGNLEVGDILNLNISLKCIKCMKSQLKSVFDKHSTICSMFLLSWWITCMHNILNDYVHSQNYMFILLRFNFFF